MIKRCEKKRRKRKGRIKLEEKYANPKIVKNTPKEIKDYYEMTYDEMCNYLTNKYGKSTKPFYVTETFKTKFSDPRFYKEGIFLHNIYEKYIPQLSDYVLSHDPKLQNIIAKNYSYSYQKAENLIYCNYIEHLFLHYLIIRNRIKNSYFEGLNFEDIREICHDLNNYYFYKKYRLGYMNAVKVIDGNYKDYIYLLKNIINLIRTNDLFEYCNVKPYLFLSNLTKECLKKIYIDLNIL